MFGSNVLNVLPTTAAMKAILIPSRLETLERLEQLERRQFTLNFDPTYSQERPRTEPPGYFVSTKSIIGSAIIPQYLSLLIVGPR